MAVENTALKSFSQFPIKAPPSGKELIKPFLDLGCLSVPVLLMEPMGGRSVGMTSQNPKAEANSLNTGKLISSPVNASIGRRFSPSLG